MNLDDSDSVVFPPNTAIIDEGRLWSVMPTYLYVPKASNQVGFDSFCQLGAVLYGFQFTVTNNHDSDIKKGIEECLSAVSGQLDGLPPKENWWFVFITPRGCEVVIKATSVWRILGRCDTVLGALGDRTISGFITLPDVLRRVKLSGFETQIGLGWSWLTRRAAYRKCTNPLN